MSKITLYGFEGSQPVRACLLTLKALNLPFEFKQVDVIMTKDHHSKEYLEKNPQHTVPTLEDEGHFIWDSHAIIAYLVDKYGKDDALYPKDLLKRAAVDQRLYFESGVIFQGALRNIFAFLIYKDERSVPQHKLDAIVEVYDFLETFLKDHPYMAGDTLTIADFSIISSVSSLVTFVAIEAGKYAKLTAWIKRMEQLPYYQEANGNGAQQFADVVVSKNFTIV